MATEYDEIIRRAGDFAEHNKYIEALAELEKLKPLHESDYPKWYRESPRLDELWNAYLYHQIGDLENFNVYLDLAYTVSLLEPNYNLEFAEAHLQKLAGNGVQHRVIDYLFGDIAYRKSDYAKAQKFNESALIKQSSHLGNPSPVVLLVRLGYCAFFLDKNEEARSYFMKAIEAEPDNEWPKKELGCLLCIMDDYEGAVTMLSGLVEDEDKKLLYYRGTAYLRLGNNEQAINDLGRAYKMEADKDSFPGLISDYAAALNDHAGDLFKNGAIEEAIPFLERSIEVCPTNQAKENLELMKGNKTASDMKRKSPAQEHFLLGVHAVGEGKDETVVREMEKALKLGLSGQDYVAAAAWLGMTKLDIATSNEEFDLNSPDIQYCYVLVEKAADVDSKESIGYLQDTRIMPMLLKLDLLYCFQAKTIGGQNGGNAAIEFLNSKVSLFNYLIPNPMICSFLDLGNLYAGLGYESYALECWQRVLSSQESGLYKEHGDRIRSVAAENIATLNS